MIHLHRSTGCVAALLCVSLLGACASTKAPKPVRAPALAFAPTVECTSVPDFSDPISRSTNTKARKVEMRNRKISLRADMGSDGRNCLSVAETRLPYAVFSLPKGLWRPVVNAGSILDERVMFAARVLTYDANGTRIREFAPDEFRRLGALHGVQFSPRPNEAYIVMTADPDLVGERIETVETRAVARQVSNYGLGGTYGSGTNTVGQQRDYSRVFAYNGRVAIDVVFPKQPK